MQITKQCTGCMACFNNCPNGAINVSYDEAGFYTPKIDENKCIKCRLCVSVCPQENMNVCKNKETDNCYAITCCDEIRQNSASGGAFAMLASHFLENGGYVCGATFANNYRKVEHILINKKEDLIKLQNSKYIQSYIGNILTETKNLLEEGNQILFSGTPCQIAGLKAYLGKEYTNLYTIEILCHGIPSPLVWEKYVNEVAQNRKVLNASFRSKKYGWRGGFHLEFKYRFGSFSQHSSENVFLRGFLDDIIINESCYSCKYTTLNRIGDITLGDFWAINKYKLELDDNKGLSMVLINNEKGNLLINTIKNNFDIFEEVDLSKVLPYTSRLNQPAELNPHHENFIKNINKMSVIKNLKQNLCPKYEGVITNFWGVPNFGATLSAYAIQQYFKQHGKNYHLLHKYKLTDYTKEFAKKYLKITHYISNDIQYKELNRCVNNFVLGTDQVFRAEFNFMPSFKRGLYGFTSFFKKRTAFSGSFGTSHLDEMNFIDKLKYTKLLRRFDAISVREISGIELCKKELNLKAQFIIDPVFLIDKNMWINMAPDTDNKYKNKIVCYFLNTKKHIEKDKIKDYIKKKTGKEVVEIINEEIPIEEFISAIRDADGIVTNSFHCTCFSIIFNKKVLGIQRKAFDARFANLVELFNLPSNMIIDDFSSLFEQEELFKEYDDKCVQSVIEKERKNASKWFEKNINTNKKINIRTILAEIDYLLFLPIEKVLREILNTYVQLKVKYLCCNKNQRIVFWGASLYLKDFLKKNPKIAKNILGIIDINPKVHNGNLCGCKIYSPDKISELKPNLVISAVINNHKNIYKDIQEYLQKNYPDIKLLSDIFEWKR